MAADTRPFKSKEQDGQGNEVIVRDQQLVEQTSQTTMASGEYFEIVDVDGRMAKIPKDNMIGVVREALGTLLNGLADQTTVTKALTLNGDTLGASTAATLASVLGVNKVYIQDRVISTGNQFFKIQVNSTNFITNVRVLGGGASDFSVYEGLISTGNPAGDIFHSTIKGTLCKMYKDSSNVFYVYLPHHQGLIITSSNPKADISVINATSQVDPSTITEVD